MKVGKFEVIYIAPAPSRYQRKAKINYTKFLKVASSLVSIALFNMNTIYAATGESPLHGSNNSATEVVARLDDAGFEVFRIGCRIGYWAALIMAVWEIIKCIKDGDTNAIWGVIAKYALAFGALYMLPWIFDLIAAIFG